MARPGGRKVRFSHQAGIASRNEGHATRLVMLEAAAMQRVPPDRISFVDALRWLRQRRPGEMVATLRTNPRRPGRHKPRARKRRPSRAYPVLTRPRHIAKRNLALRKARLI